MLKAAEEENGSKTERGEACRSETIQLDEDDVTHSPVKVSKLGFVCISDSGPS